LALIEKPKALDRSRILQHDPLTYKDLQHGTFGLTFGGSIPTDMLMILSVGGRHPRSSGGGEFSKSAYFSADRQLSGSVATAADTLLLGSWIYSFSAQTLGGRHYGFLAVADLGHRSVNDSHPRIQPQFGAAWPDEFHSTTARYAGTDTNDKFIDGDWHRRNSAVGPRVMATRSSPR